MRGSPRARLDADCMSCTFLPSVHFEIQLLCLISVPPRIATINAASSHSRAAFQIRPSLLRFSFAPQFCNSCGRQQLYIQVLEFASRSWLCTQYGCSRYALSKPFRDSRTDMTSPFQMVVEEISKDHIAGDRGNASRDRWPENSNRNIRAESQWYGVRQPLPRYERHRAPLFASRRSTSTGDRR